MPELSPHRRHLRATKAGLARHGADTTAVDAAIREARARDFLTELVEGWPPLSAETRRDLAALLAPPPGGASDD